MSRYNLDIVNYQDAENLKGIESYLKNNGEPGRSCGFESLDNFYTHKDGSCTDWTGFPGSGKTYFLFELLFNLSEKYGQRHALYVPDVGNYKETMAKLLKMYTGKDFNNKNNNQITESEIYQALPWINYHFLILKKKDTRKTLTPGEFWEFVCDYKDENGIILNNGIIDSWKNMTHDIGNRREDQYLDEILSYRNELAENNNKHFHTIAHATKTELLDSVGANGKKKRRVPDANDIKGGGSWFANGKNIITIDYPDKNSNSIDIHVSKTKPEGIGKTGAVIQMIYLDYSKGRYYEWVHGRKRFSFDRIKEIKEINTNKFIEPNKTFENELTAPF